MLLINGKYCFKIPAQLRQLKMKHKRKDIHPSDRQFLSYIFTLKFTDIISTRINNI